MQESGLDDSNAAHHSPQKTDFYASWENARKSAGGICTTLIAYDFS